MLLLSDWITAIIAGQYAIYSELQSKVVLSVSEIDSHFYKGFAHGNFELQEQTLGSIIGK